LAQAAASARKAMFTMKNEATWLQLYVDAVMEKDPYKRLALVRELRTFPKHDDSEEVFAKRIVESAGAKKSKTARRRRRRSQGR
jgi:hypothetical protein